MGYWRQVHRRALARTAKGVGATPLRFLAFFAAQAAGAAAVWLILGRLGMPATEPRLVASAVPFLALPFLYLWRLVGAPAALHRSLHEEMKAQQARDAARIAALEAEVARLEAEPLPPSRDPDAIFQQGVQVGRVVLALADPATGSASFQQIVEAADFDASAEFDYRDWVLRLEGVGGDARSQIGGTRQRTLSRVVCRIERRRAWRQST
ncbi:hypothetical protein [Enhydrobacter sp.]|uniref:hypothetical protein n=1 Tax=Enhydrobacter sp. TaxID=1894999 RepID=UPI002602E935|nr:hypothetical protein [Enhydrobacter sp.]WIM09331.1 MAG: hypothetical protein OJF58_000282 [Enhydrobacter sp.]